MLGSIYYRLMMDNSKHRCLDQCSINSLINAASIHDQSIIDLVVGSADEVDLIHIIHSRNDEVDFVLMALEEVNLILVIIYEVDHGFVDVDEVDLV